ncbi:glycosyltransferase family 21 protein [Lactarius akahatsu]|uniref:Ceramide glucosyltransferase n=1 Tax=Lactarius akahatsu TaxID=416441 RepID=A0AAD4LFS2_9AGAM|nr:glycosyltransferase family 21 protein [Lactarius akahatsu]
MTNPTTRDWHHLLGACLSILGLIWYLFIWSVGLVGCWTARKKYRSRPNREPAATTVPGVSILRPLRGLDTNLLENLESSFRQEYPHFEILLSVADEHDKALPVVYELLAKYPNVNARVIIGDMDVGANPKVNNLIRPYNEATHDILWVLDSNVAVAPGTLARAVEILSHPPHPNSPRRRIALVHHVPFAISSRGATFGARVEEAFLNTNHAKMYVAINAAAVDSCVVGKSNFFRRSDLERLDGSLVPQQRQHDSGQQRGLAAFSRFLAEDNMIGLSLWHELNLRHDLSCDVAHNTLGDMNLSDYVWRRVRWIRVRKRMSLAATLLEPLTESVMLSVIAATSTQFLTGVTPHLFLPTHFILWILIDLDVYASLAGHALPSSKRWGFLVAWVVREVLAFPIWILAMMGDEVEWRGRRYKVMQNGEVARR